jgi:hypothetical protein
MAKAGHKKVLKLYGRAFGVPAAEPIDSPETPSSPALPLKPHQVRWRKQQAELVRLRPIWEKRRTAIFSDPVAMAGFMDRVLAMHERGEREYARPVEARRAEPLADALLFKEFKFYFEPPERPLESAPSSNLFRAALAVAALWIEPKEQIAWAREHANLEKDRMMDLYKAMRGRGGENPIPWERLAPARQYPLPANYEARLFRPAPDGRTLGNLPNLRTLFGELLDAQAASGRLLQAIGREWMALRNWHNLGDQILDPEMIERMKRRVDWTLHQANATLREIDGLLDGTRGGVAERGADRLRWVGDLVAELAGSFSPFVRRKGRYVRLAGNRLSRECRERVTLAMKGLYGIDILPSTVRARSDKRRAK